MPSPGSRGAGPIPSSAMPSPRRAAEHSSKIPALRTILPYYHFCPYLQERPFGRKPGAQLGGKARIGTRKESAMKHFLIKYRFKDGSEAAWRDRIGQFI